MVVDTQRPAQEYGDESLAPGDGPSDDEPRKEQRGDLQPERREAPAASAVSVYKQTKIIQMQNLFDTGLASGFLTAEEVSDGKREWGKTKTIEDVNVVYLKYKRIAEDRYLAGESEGKREQGSEGSMSDLEKRVEALRTQVKAMGGGAKIFQEWLVKKLERDCLSCRRLLNEDRAAPGEAVQYVEGGPP